MSIMVSHSGKPQLLSMVPLYLQNQDHLYTLPHLAASTRYNLGFLWITTSLCYQETHHRRVHLSDVALFLIIINFLAPANKHQAFKQIKILLQQFWQLVNLKAHSSAPTTWNHRILNTLFYPYFKMRIMCPKLPSSAASWSWNLAPLFTDIFTSFLFSFTG